MTETTGATYELAKDSIAEDVPAPAVGISTFDLVGLFPAFLLNGVREAPRVRVRIIVRERGDVVVDVEESGRG